MGDGNLPIEIGLPRTYSDPVPSAEPNTLLDSALNANQSAPAKPSEALELLREDIAAHRTQMANKSYLGYAVSAVAGLGRTDTFSPVERLNDQLTDALKKGDTEAAKKLAAEARGLVAADKQSSGTYQTIEHYGSDLLKTTGLFIPGKVGYALAGATYALDQAKPGESVSNQLVDGGLGLTKGLALKGTFDHVGSTNLGIAAKAVSLGVSSRLLDSGLTRSTYTSADGTFDLAQGLSKTLDQSFSKSALVSDVVTFGIAHTALGGINGITGGALKSSPFWSTVATGGVFGVSTGSVGEINRQYHAGEKFDFQKVLTAAALTGVTDMVAAAPGGKMLSVAQRPVSIERPESAVASEPVLKNGGWAQGSDALTRTAETHERLADNSEPVRINPIIQRNFAGSNAREFQLASSDQNVIEQLRAAPDQPVHALVKEVGPSGELGSIKIMVVQHLESQSLKASLNGVNWGAFRGADLLATCNPESLPQPLQSKHIMPTAESIYVTQDQSGRLRFTDSEPAELKPGESEPVRLDSPFRASRPVKTVSELLLGPEVPEYVGYTHDRGAIARAMLHYKAPVRFFESGVDNITFELADGNILKITDRGWDPSWGSREIWTPQGPKLTDARILRRPQTVDLPDAPVTYFIQQRLINPVTAGQLKTFDRQIEQDGTYKFWDNDFKEHGRKQLGLDPNTRETFLIDYDAMRLPHLVPKFEPESQDSLVDRVLERYGE